MRLLLVFTFLTAPMFGCVKRTITVTSNPSGALVWVNEREMGRTPLTFDFTYYGEYDVRIEEEGSEPIMTSRWAKAPVWDLPVVDVVVETFSDQESNIAWHFDLIERNDDPELLLRRARGARHSVIGEDVE